MGIWHVHFWRGWTKSKCFKIQVANIRGEYLSNYSLKIDTNFMTSIIGKMNSSFLFFVELPRNYATLYC
jgi:hypothetical protein